MRIGLAAAVACLPGCKSREISDPVPPKRAHYHEAEHPENRRLLKKLNPIWWIQNTDDPVPPDWYRPGEPLRNMKWRLRNPFHNFTFYVIGVADRDFTRYGLHAGSVFNPNSGWNFAVIPVFGVVPLPFFSYKGPHLKFYLLWRERGNFGAKLNISLKGKYGEKKKDEKPRKTRDGPKEQT